ncbi:retrovirus-related pol polyprotein from transposon TNT 1-94 [Tanacetum coccineum]
MTITGTKWVFRNKLDENGVVSRNNVRLVAQGYNQQEYIDYVPWSSRLLSRMIPEPGDANRAVPVNETLHEQTDDELTEKELKQVEADDQAIHTNLLGLPEDIYAAVDSFLTICVSQKLLNDFKTKQTTFQKKICQLNSAKFLNNLQLEWSRHVTIVHQTKDLHTADYTQLYDFLKYNQKEVDDLRAELLAKTHDPLALMNYMEQPMTNPEDITDPTTAMNIALVLMANAFKLNYSTPTNNNQRISSNPRNSIKCQASGCSECNVGNQNRLIVVLGIANQNRNGLIRGEYTELLEPIPEPYQVQQNDSNVISEVSSVEQSGGTVDQHPATVEEIPDESLAKHKALELEIERLLRAVVSQDIMSIVQSNSVVDTSNLQTKLEPYNDMQQKIERLQAHLGDLKGKYEDTPCVSDTLDPLSQKLENKNIEFETSEQKDTTKGVDNTVIPERHTTRSKDEAPEVIKTFLKRITVLLQSPVIIIRTDNGTEFKNQILKEYFDSVGISHQASSVRTPQQNGVVERRNRTLVEAARTMLIFSRAPLFLWAEAIATACYTQNRSIIHRRFNKTPYELQIMAKNRISTFHIYSADSCAYMVTIEETKENHGDN